MIERYEADPDPLNLHAELAAARAIFHDFVERYDAWREAFLAWHASFLSQRGRYERAVENFRFAARAKDGNKMMVALTDLSALEAEHPETPKPREVLDIADARNTILSIAKIVDTIERIKNANAISRPELLRVLAEMGRVVERYVTDAPTRESIKDGWQGMRLA